MNNKNNIILGSMFIVILGLIFYIIISKPNTTVNKFDETELRLQIQKSDSNVKYWENQAKYFETLAGILKEKSDSLESLKPKINEKYNNKVNFNNTANISQLDSVIRSNWN